MLNRQWDLMKKKAKKDVALEQLFYGTKPRYVDFICHDHLDWRVCGTNGTGYGKGEFNFFEMGGESSPSLSSECPTNTYSKNIWAFPRKVDFLSHQLTPVCKTS